MPRRSNQQKLIEAATAQIAAGIASLFRLLAPAAPADAAQRARRRGRPPAPAVKPRRKRRQTAKTRRQFKLQGAYMGLVRQLPAAQKAKLKKLRQVKGYEAAIAAARKLLVDK